MDPELVAGLEVGHLRDGEGEPGTGDTHFQLGTGEVEAGAIGPCLLVRRKERHEGPEEEQGEDGRLREEKLVHGPSLDGECGRGGGLGCGSNGSGEGFVGRLGCNYLEILDGEREGQRQRQRQKQIPFGDDNQKSNSNGKDNGDGNCNCNGRTRARVMATARVEANAPSESRRGMGKGRMEVDR